MTIYKDLIIFIIGLIVIIKSADLFTDGAEGIAQAFRIPRLIIGITIVSLATTAPELTVSVFSSAMGVGGIAVGNAIGSCLANIGLVLAIAAIIKVIHFNPRVVKQDILLLLGFALVVYLLMSDGILSFWDGASFTFLLVIFFGFVVLRELKARRKTLQEKKNNQVHNLKRDILKFLFGAIGVVISARFAIIPSGVNIAKFLGVPEVVIGLSMVAVGTSLPELFTAIIASIKKMEDMAAGNVIGANILNLILVLGVSSMVKPLSIDIQTLRFSMPMMVGITILMLLFARTKFRLSRNEGLAILVIYIGYIFYLFKFAYS